MKNEIVVSVAVTFLFLSLGFLMLHFDLVGYGFSFFAILPFLLGYLLGNKLVKKWSLVCMVLTVILFIVLLLAGGLEGMVCVLFALPPLIVAFFVGNLIRYLFRGVRKEKEEAEENLLKSSVVPFLLFAFLGIFEKWWRHDPQQYVEVRSEIELPYSPLQVYDAIKSVDTLIAEKPWLMKLDLPVPHKCVLEAEKVGGLRTCHFDGGLIVERITELEPGKVLDMDVIDYQLTGRKWLGFRKAKYLFAELPNGGCRMSRITGYTSVLYPRFYWEPLERLGIEQEHAYVFGNLRRDLKLVHGR
jgi:amino acid transporter